MSFCADRSYFSVILRRIGPFVAAPRPVRDEGTPHGLWASLNSLWAAISKHSNGGTVCMPVIGGGMSRLSSIVPTQDSIRFTILSFMFASRSNKVCDELRIVVRPQDYQRLDRLELQAFLTSFKPS
jgi:hypothetical protein